MTGLVYLDTPDLALALEEAGRDQVRAVIEHELAHLVGLAHVDDEAELMLPYAGEALELGRGDRAGLAQLGAGPCVPEI